MAIKTDVIEYVRTMLTGDTAANDIIEERLDADGWDGYPTLLGSVFYHAVNLHFGGKPDEAGVVRLVADMLSDDVADGQGIDAQASETLINAALDPSIDFQIAPDMVGKIQTLALLKIAETRKLGPAEVEELLNKSIALADRHS